MNTAVLAEIYPYSTDVTDHNVSVDYAPEHDAPLLTAPVLGWRQLPESEGATQHVAVATKAHIEPFTVPEGYEPRLQTRGDVIAEAVALSIVGLPKHAVVRIRHARDGIKLISQAAREDLASSKHPYRVLANRAGYLVIKYGAGRTGLPSAAVATSSMFALEATQSAPVVAITAAVTSAVWSKTAASVISSTIDHHPRAFRAAKDSFPDLNRGMSESLPGLLPRTAEEESALAQKSPVARYMTNRALDVEQALSAISRITPFLCAAGREGFTKQARRRLATRLSIGAGAVKGVMYFGIAETILKITEYDPDLAMRIHQDIKDPLVWSSIGNILAGKNYAVKVIKRRTAKKHSQPDQTETEDDVTEASGAPVTEPQFAGW